MEYFEYNDDEYQPLKQGNEFAPISPFRMVVAGSSGSRKTSSYKSFNGYCKIVNYTSRETNI